MVEIDARNQGNRLGADRTVRQYASADRKCFLEIVVTEDGLYKHVMSRHFEDPYGDYIAPIKWSGLYASAGDAEREARAEFEWLAEALPEPIGP